MGSTQDSHKKIPVVMKPYEEGIDEKTTGLYRKYSKIERSDGGHLPGRKHENCEYFVLDLNHDPFAIYALIGYAMACGADYPELALDLQGKVEEMVDRQAKEGQDKNTG